MRRGLGSLVCGVALLVVGRAEAGHVDYLSNLSADFIRTLNRAAAIDAADIAVYNPAGTAMMAEDGLYLNFSGQTVFKDYAITYDGQRYTTNKPTPILPSFFALFKWGRWAGFGAFTVPAGGGSLTYEKGVPYLLPLGLLVNPTSPIPTNGRFEGSSMYLGGTFGVAYRVIPMLSLSAAGRVISAKKTYVGSADYGTTAAALDSTKTAVGGGGVFGIHLQPLKGLNIGLRYETEVALNFKSSTTMTNISVDLAKMSALKYFVDGATENRNLQPVLALGVSYDILPKLSANVGLNYYFLRQADEPDETGALGAITVGYNDEQGDGIEVGGGFEYRFLPQLLASVGVLYSRSGANAKTYTDFEYSLSSCTVGTGVRYRPLPRLGLTAAFATAIYFKGENESLSATAKLPAETFEKIAYLLTIGAEYRLF